MLFRSAARESVPYYRQWELSPSMLQGAADLSGYVFELDLAQTNVANVEISLGMAATALADGFTILSGPGLLLSIRIAAATLQGVPDTTGDFQLFGDLIATPPGGDPFFVADLILPVTKGTTTP